jgi:adenylosuccinate lyase
MPIYGRRACGVFFSFDNRAFYGRLRKKVLKLNIKYVIMETIMENLNSPAFAISPVDGRYSDKTIPFRYIFSEYALMKNRFTVEVEYLINLVPVLNKTGYIKKKFTKIQIGSLRSLYERFSEKDFDEIKKFEKSTNHDVKAVEYFFRAKLQTLHMGEYVALVHWGLTSEDPNNISYTTCIINGTNTLAEEYRKTMEAIEKFAIKGKFVPELIRTHGQPANPSEVGWTVIVPLKRMERIYKKIGKQKHTVKFGGASGGNNARIGACSEVDWRKFNERFVSHLNKKLIKIKINHYSFQIDSHDTYKELFEIFTSLNTILIDFCVNTWGYISQEHFVQIPKEGEVGSSALPQKINPIDFENCEGNLAFANCQLEFFSRRLPNSRGYRDLTDSTIQRYIGISFANILIALKSIQKGLSRIEINKPFLEEELENHWELVTEGYQTILRLEGVEKGYEIMLEATRGKKVTKEILHMLVDKITMEFDLTPKVVEKLKSITPHNYTGDRSF